MSKTDPPALVRLSEGLGPNAQPVARKELSAALDTGGSVVLIDRNGDIVFYVTDGKMQVQRRGRECDACILPKIFAWPKPRPKLRVTWVLAVVLVVFATLKRWDARKSVVEFNRTPPIRVSNHEDAKSSS